MKTLLALIATAATLAAQSLSDPSFVAALTVPAAAGGGATYIYEEGFEGTGTPSGWAVTGTPNFDATTPTPPEGYQCLELAASSGDVTAATGNGTSYGPLAETWRKFRMYVGALPGANNRSLLEIRTDTTVLGRFYLEPDGQLQGRHGTTSFTPTDAIPTSTWIYIWFHWKAATDDGTPNDGVADIEWNTTNSRTGSGTKFASTTTGNAASFTTNNDLWRADYNGDGITIYIDDCKADNAQID